MPASLANCTVMLKEGQPLKIYIEVPRQHELSFAKDFRLKAVSDTTNHVAAVSFYFISQHMKHSTDSVVASRRHAAIPSVT